MKALPILLAAGALVSFTPGCGDLHPRIDSNSCASILGSVDPNGDQCASCCNDNGYHNASFINQDRCTCGWRDDETDTTTCPAKIASDSECSSCCLDAGYFAHWITAVTPICTCDLKPDRTICASPVSLSNPAAQCDACCMYHGYLAAVDFAGDGTGCACYM